MQAFGVPLQRWVLIGLAPLMALVFWSGTTDPVNLPKATLAALAALLVLTVNLIRVAATRRLVVPLTPSLWAAVALAAGLLIATAVSDVPRASFASSMSRSPTPARPS